MQVENTERLRQKIRKAIGGGVAIALDTHESVGDTSDSGHRVEKGVSDSIPVSISRGGTKPQYVGIV